MIWIAAAVLAGAGIYLVTSRLPGRPPVVGPPPTPARLGARVRLDRAGLGDVGAVEIVATSGVLLVAGAGLAFGLFGGLAPAAVVGGFAATFPPASYRARRNRRMATAREAWPRLIDELRLLTGALGRSIPQGLFDVGRRAPAELQPAFRAAEREWLLTTDFARTLDVLKALLGDPTADVVCETLAVAHEVGGGDLDRRLAELVEDRIVDLQGRKEAETRQAGVRFARRFVLLVPLGMALAGLSIGTGRTAYEAPLGQLAVVGGLAVVVACWIWSGRLMVIPPEPRIFVRPVATAVPAAGEPTAAGGGHARRVGGSR